MNKKSKGSLCDFCCQSGNPGKLLYYQEDWRKRLMCVSGREVKKLFSIHFVVICDISELNFIYLIDLFLFES